MDNEIKALHEKLDLVLEQLNETRRRQQEMEELRRDLTPIATDLFNTAAEELDKVSPYFTYEDLIYLGTKLLRNIRHLTSLFESMESAVDFVKDAGPLSKDMFDSGLETLDRLEKRGYFEFFAALVRIADQVITNLSQEDMNKLSETIPKLAEAFVVLSRTNLLDSLTTAAKTFQENSEIPEKASLIKILKEANDPHVRRLMLMGLSFAKTVSTRMQHPDQTEERSGII